MTLTPSLTPPERMAEIRRLTREIRVVKAVCLEQRNLLSLMTDGLDVHDWTEEMWAMDESANDILDNWMCLQDELYEHLDRAEADGSLAECEQMLRVSHSGVL